MKLFLSVIWLIGAVLFLILHIKRYFSFKRAVKRISSPLCDESTADILESEKQKLKITSDIPVRVSSAADTPMLVGIIHPFIILSENEFSDDELHFIFRHELIHYKRKDILYQLITLIFISLNWYNPFAYIMARAIEIDGETVDYYDKDNDHTTFIDDSGRMIVSLGFDNRMNIDCHGYNMYNENGGINPNAMMHIVP